MENLPLGANFDSSAPYNQKEFITVSNCCGAYHPYIEDYGICPQCKEHCDFEQIEN